MIPVVLRIVFTGAKSKKWNIDRLGRKNAILNANKMPKLCPKCIFGSCLTSAAETVKYPTRIIQRI